MSPNEHSGPVQQSGGHQTLGTARAMARDAAHAPSFASTPGPSSLVMHTLVGLPTYCPMGDTA